MTDTRAAWTGLYQDRADLPVRIEAASFHNRPVYFQVLFPWTPAARLARAAPNPSRNIRDLADYAIGAIVFIVALWIAHHNWRAGRTDLRGAARVGIFCGVMSLIAWLFQAHHVALDAEQILVANALANAAYICVEYWLIYLALEPWVRRYWPQTMITWSRAVAGRWNDPVVGRDLLFGAFFGIVYLLIVALYEYASLRNGVPFLGTGLDNLNGLRAFAGYIPGQLFKEVGGSLIFLLTLFLVRAVLKKNWIVATVWVVGWVAVRFLRSSFTDPSQQAITSGIFWTLLFFLLVFIMLRFGFFALVVALFVLDTLTACFLTTDFSAWYGQSSFAVVIGIVAMALWAFRLSLGSRSLFSPVALSKT